VFGVLIGALGSFSVLINWGKGVDVKKLNSEELILYGVKVLLSEMKKRGIESYSLKLNISRHGLASIDNLKTGEHHRATDLRP
jgi:hypothetical protein